MTIVLASKYSVFRQSHNLDLSYDSKLLNISTLLKNSSYIFLCLIALYFTIALKIYQLNENSVTFVSDTILAAQGVEYNKASSPNKPPALYVVKYYS